MKGDGAASTDHRPSSDLALIAFTLTVAIAFALVVATVVVVAVVIAAIVTVALIAIPTVVMWHLLLAFAAGPIAVKELLSVVARA